MREQAKVYDYPAHIGQTCAFHHIHRMNFLQYLMSARELLDGSVLLPAKSKLYVYEILYYRKLKLC